MTCLGVSPPQKNGPPPLALYLSNLGDDALAATLLKAARVGFHAFYTDEMADTLAIYRASVLLAGITGTWNTAKRARLFGLDRLTYERALEAGRREAILGEAHPFSEACALMMDILHDDCRRSRL